MMANQTVSVTNVAPSFDPGPGVLIRANSLFQRTLNFTDPGADTAIRQITDPDSMFRGGLSVAVGDVNGDRKPDIITGALALGNSWVRVYDGNGTGSVPLKAFQAFSAAGDNPQAAVQVPLRDIDGDGKAEVLAAQGPNGTASGTVVNSKPIRCFKPLDGSQVDNFFATSPDFARGLFLG